MASVGEEEEEVEYESDPEESKLSLTMRRREASDDEEEDEEKHKDEIVSDYESDGQGAPAEYDDEQGSEIEELEDEEEIEVVAVVEEVDNNGVRSVGEVDGIMKLQEVKREDQEFEAPTEGEYYNNEDLDGENVAGVGGEEDKKENEPFAVPTAGAFYMHDDRFRDSTGGGVRGGGRHRRTLGGRKLWESKDERKWGHDKFEEMTFEERQYDEGRRVSRGRFRGRGRNRGEDRGYPRENKPKAYNNITQNNPPKGVRGRGPRRYQPTWKRNSEAPAQNRQPGKSVDRTSSYASSGRVSTPTSNVESDSVPANSKHVFASSLNSASPPFYPSGSSNKDSALTQKRDSQAAPINRNPRSSVSDENFSMSQSNAMRAKNVVDSISMDKLYIDDSVSIPTGKPLTNLQLPPSRSSLINSTQSPQSKIQGRGQTPSGHMSYQTTAPANQINRVSPTAQTRLQSSVQASGQRSGSGSQASSPPKAALLVKSFESGEMGSPPESSKSKTALVGKGKGSVQSSGRGSFPYGGAQIMGASVNMGGGHGDQNFSGAPAFLPVMQFGGQHPGGMGVPAVGMAFPGYVAQPQLGGGLGNSEMTWLPVLAGAAGAMGATYYGAYHGSPSGQTSSLAAISSKENIGNKSGNELKPSQRLELANDEFGQRQNKARRYTEMKFDQ